MKVVMNGIVLDVKTEQGLKEKELINLIHLMQSCYTECRFKVQRLSDEIYIIMIRKSNNYNISDSFVLGINSVSELDIYLYVERIIKKLNSIKHYYDLSKINTDEVFEFKFGRRKRVRYNMSEDIEEELKKTYDTADVTYVLIGKYRIKVSIRDIKIEFVYKFDRLSTFDYNIQSIENIINSCIVGIERRRKKC